MDTQFARRLEYRGSLTYTVEHTHSQTHKLAFLSVVSLTFIEGAPTSHQTRAARRGLQARGKTHGGHMVRQDHRRGQLYQGYVVVERLWVELERRQRESKVSVGLA